MSASSSRAIPRDTRWALYSRSPQSFGQISMSTMHLFLISPECRIMSRFLIATQIHFFLCAAATTSQLREVNGRTTYRSRYDGNFSNISPSNFLGAHHAAELPLIFGTAGNYHGGSTAYENVVSGKMQDLWLEFATVPHNGLRNGGWNPYAEGKAMLLGDTDTLVRQIDIFQLDNVCTTQ